MNHRVYEKILKNKMPVLLIPMNQTDTISVGIIVKVGSRYETEETNGISHFLEHMMFKGTKHYPRNNIAEKLDSVGAIYNAETSYETTYYYIYGHKNDAELFIKIICDIYNNPLFREDDIITERGVVVEEFNMYKDDPQDIIQNLLHEILFSNSSLKFSILGTKKNIMSFTRKDLLAFRKKYYLPERAIMVISGNFDRNIIFPYIEKQMNRKNQTTNISDDKIIMPINEIPLIQTKPLIKILDKKDKGLTNVMIVFRSEGIYSKKYEIYGLIENILTNGSSSRLFDLLRNKLGIVYYVNSFNLSYSKEGVFVINMNVDDKHVNESIEAVLKELSEIKRLKSKYITKEELDKSKKIKTISFSLGLQTPQAYASYFTFQKVYYDDERPFNIESRIAKYESITLDDINMVLHELFRSENLNILIYGTAPKTISTL